MRIFKILFFIAISTFLSSCHYDSYSPPIKDTDGDGISDTLNLVNDVYEYRTTYFMQDNIRKYISRLKNPVWYKPDTLLSATYSSIIKNDVQYETSEKYTKTAEVYKIIKDTTTPTGTMSIKSTS